PLGAGHVRHQVDEPDAEPRAAPGRPVQDLDALAPQRRRAGKSLGEDDRHGAVQVDWTAARRRPLFLSAAVRLQAALALACVAASRAWSRSARMSSMCSMPTERRT